MFTFTLLNEFIYRLPTLRRYSKSKRDVLTNKKMQIKDLYFLGLLYIYHFTIKKLIEPIHASKINSLIFCYSIKLYQNC